MNLITVTQNLPGSALRVIGTGEMKDHAASATSRHHNEQKRIEICLNK